MAANELRGIYDDLENQLNKANKDVEDWKAKSERLEVLIFLLIYFIRSVGLVGRKYRTRDRFLTAVASSS